MKLYIEQADVVTLSKKSMITLRAWLISGISVSILFVLMIIILFTQI